MFEDYSLNFLEANAASTGKFPKKEKLLIVRFDDFTDEGFSFVLSTSDSCRMVNDLLRIHRFLHPDDHLKVPEKRPPDPTEFSDQTRCNSTHAGFEKVALIEEQTTIALDIRDAADPPYTRLLLRLEDAWDLLMQSVCALYCMGAELKDRPPA